MPRQGLLLIVSGPSGTGKGTVCNVFLNGRANMHYSISLTTREPRKGEVNGRDYFFVSKEEFTKLIEEDQLLEYAKVYDNYYGTPRKYVMAELEQGYDVLLEIEMDGAGQIKNKFGNGIFVFILPPSLEELAARLRKRERDNEEEIKKRFQSAVSEIGQAERYDYVLVNNKVEETVEALSAIVRAEQAKVVRNLKMIEDVRSGLESIS